MAETELKQRPSIFLYTDAAAITDEVRIAMIEAGYLPVRVASVDDVRILTNPVTYDGVAIPLVTQAALEALLKSNESVSTWTSRFGACLARLLLKDQKP